MRRHPLPPVERDPKVTDLWTFLICLVVAFVAALAWGSDRDTPEPVRETPQPTWVPMTQAPAVMTTIEEGG